MYDINEAKKNMKTALTNPVVDEWVEKMTEIVDKRIEYNSKHGISSVKVPYKDVFDLIGKNLSSSTFEYIEASSDATITKLGKTYSDSGYNVAIIEAIYNLFDVAAKRDKVMQKQYLKISW